MSCSIEIIVSYEKTRGDHLKSAQKALGLKRNSQGGYEEYFITSRMVENIPRADAFLSTKTKKIPELIEFKRDENV